MYDGDSEELPPSLGSDTSSDDESSSIDDYEEVEQEKRKYTYAEEIICTKKCINKCTYSLLMFIFKCVSGEGFCLS